MATKRGAAIYFARRRPTRPTALRPQGHVGRRRPERLRQGPAQRPGRHRVDHRPGHGKATGRGPRADRRRLGELPERPWPAATMSSPSTSTSSGASCSVTQDLTRISAGSPTRSSRPGTSQPTPGPRCPSRPRANGRTCPQAQLIRLGFPEWSIWSLPLVAREFGHVFARKRERVRADMTEAMDQGVATERNCARGRRMYSPPPCWARPICGRPPCCAPTQRGRRPGPGRGDDAHPRADEPAR